jgi:hypothetical protein
VPLPGLGISLEKLAYANNDALGFLCKSLFPSDNMTVRGKAGSECIIQWRGWYKTNLIFLLIALLLRLCFCFLGEDTPSARIVN